MAATYQSDWLIKWLLWVNLAHPAGFGSQRLRHDLAFLKGLEAADTSLPEISASALQDQPLSEPGGPSVEIRW